MCGSDHCCWATSSLANIARCGRAIPCRFSSRCAHVGCPVRWVADAVRTGTPVACAGEDGRWAVAMCLAARESLGQGRPVPLAGG